MKRIGEILKSLRLKKGVGQSEVSEYLNVTVATYSDYERGKSEPKIKNIKLLSEYFTVSTDFLLGLENKNVPLISKTDESIDIEKCPPNCPPNSPPNQSKYSVLMEEVPHYGNKKEVYKSIETTEALTQLLELNKLLIERFNNEIEGLKGKVSKLEKNK